MLATTWLLSGLVYAQQFNSRFFNPILPGFHPDPSCIFHKLDSTFYCASSSFNVFPGIPIHASKDLTNWRLIGHALNRETQLPELAASVGSTSGIWAPALRFHNGTFYLLTTMVHDKKATNDSSRWDNIIFSTPDLWDNNKWSNAVHFDFNGYDVSPHWDDEGDSYIVGSHAWKVAYGIHLNRVDLKTGALLGNWANLWNGTGGIAPEGPHIFRKDGYYYLMIAEGGGTGLDHMETIARSKDLYGPYDPNSVNPILTNANSSEYFQAVGHADLFQDARGQWWGVALAVRSGPEWLTFPMGRETILTNVTWENGTWPVFHNPVQGDMRGWSLPGIILDLPGNGPFVDEGDNKLTFPPNSSIPPHFVYWRPPNVENYAISPPGHPNTLRLKPSKLNLTALDGNSPGPGGQTFISRRQVDTLFTFSFDLAYQPTTLNEEAGITLFLSQNHHARFGIAMLPLAANGILVPHFRFHAISHIRVPPDFTAPVDETWRYKPLTLTLRTVNITHYAFGAGPADGSVPLRTIAYVSGDIISWGFTGALLGAYATSNGGNGTAEAYVTNWNYQGWGQVRENWNGTVLAKGIKEASLL
ncbi:glycoside hydrolase family 43 protein [Cucurbitaria berberidis CBS 394.84]|uniref:Glycoside hydrolase family 43 protein n=1 Tax=Cucurbitaria berberidis CBS 394.84 TaxID=1168544 RepID=A0A9P4L7V3_9PLEO|nr:glycoside hydrolase family 43 protein [Cucurbitaria berberidis CBS 394.84]KAF1845391.1 glycoside hydrolase family 43 protein [Cucurbitaria berberidis CBS 394.84]